MLDVVAVTSTMNELNFEESQRTLLDMGLSMQTRSLCASHICYLAAGCKIGVPISSSFCDGKPPIDLLGITREGFEQNAASLAAVEAIQATEVLEWVEQQQRDSSQAQDETAIALQTHKLTFAR